MQQKVAKLQATYRGRLQRSGRGFLVKPQTSMKEAGSGKRSEWLLRADTVQYLNQQVKPALVPALVHTAIEHPTDPMQQLCARVR